ncbi:hypothetical protein BC332_14268 [Capsicum chinense]|nr:hypothetical protein BC332_14268 [Capsicum chinense]
MSRQRSQFQYTVSITFRFSHPPNRFKVDVNAQQNRMTGIAVISGDMSVVAVEGLIEAAARKVFADAVVPNYWDHDVNFKYDEISVLGRSSL